MLMSNPVKIALFKICFMQFQQVSMIHHVNSDNHVRFLNRTKNTNCENYQINTDVLLRFIVKVLWLLRTVAPDENFFHLVKIIYPATIEFQIGIKKKLEEDYLRNIHAAWLKMLERIHKKQTLKQSSHMVIYIEPYWISLGITNINVVKDFPRNINATFPFKCWNEFRVKKA